MKIARHSSRKVIGETSGTRLPERATSSYPSSAASFDDRAIASVAPNELAETTRALQDMAGELPSAEKASHNLQSLLEEVSRPPTRPAAPDLARATGRDNYVAPRDQAGLPSGLRVEVGTAASTHSKKPSSTWLKGENFVTYLMILSLRPSKAHRHGINFLEKSIRGSMVA